LTGQPADAGKGVQWHSGFLISRTADAQRHASRASKRSLFRADAAVGVLTPSIAGLPDRDKDTLVAAGVVTIQQARAPPEVLEPLMCPKPETSRSL